MRTPVLRRELPRIPIADRKQHAHADERHERQKGDRFLTMRRDDEGGEQRACRRAEVAADLKQRLRQPMLAARGHAGDARSLRMEDG